MSEFLVGISGKVGSGKTTTADYLSAKFGITTHLEISDFIVEEMNEDLKRKGLPLYIPGVSDKEAYRPQMVELGIARRIEDPAYWIKKVMPHINGGTSIGGIRYENEIQGLQKLKGEVWRVRRPKVDDDPENTKNSAATETQLDKYKYFDAVIMNCWGKLELYRMIDNLMRTRSY